MLALLTAAIHRFHKLAATFARGPAHLFFLVEGLVIHAVDFVSLLLVILSYLSSHFLIYDLFCWKKNEGDIP